MNRPLPDKQNHKQTSEQNNDQQQQKLQQVLDRLRGLLEHLPATIPRQWFSAELFSRANDQRESYLAEIEQNLRQLSALNRQSESYQYLAELVDKQLQAMTQALVKAKKPTSRPRQLTGEHQQLAQYRQYEQRLLDNLRMAEREAPQQVAQCQARLERCRSAMRALELKIG